VRSIGDVGTIGTNPCLSGDFCLDFPRLLGRLQAAPPAKGGPGASAEGEGAVEHLASAFTTEAGTWTLAEDASGDHAWLLQPSGSGGADVLAAGAALADGRLAFPASWDNLITLKNLIQESDPGATIFPTAAGALYKQSLGIGARFTALHWPAVDWAMANLGLSLTANQNSIPRELVYDVDAMLDGELDMIPFPFIGSSIPEGHQVRAFYPAAGNGHAARKKPRKNSRSAWKAKHRHEQKIPTRAGKTRRC